MADFDGSFYDGTSAFGEIADSTGQDLVPPVIDTFSPTDGSTIARTGTAGFHVTDDTGTVTPFVFVLFADGTEETVYDGSAFVGAYTGSTKGTIANGYSFTVSRSGNGWRSATIAFTIVAIDGGGNVVTDSSYNLVISNPASVPVIDTLSPADGSTITRAGTASFHVTDESGSLVRAVVAVTFADGTSEVVHDGVSFLGAYASSTRGSITNGYSFTISRSGNGWRSATLVFTILAFDGDGNITASTTYDLVVSNPAAVPVVDTFSPADGATILRTASAGFHTTDEGGTPSRVVVAAVLADGTNELVHDGSAFVGAYTGSTRGVISNGYSWTILHASPGWPSSVAFKIFVFDADGNVTADTSYNLVVSNPPGAPTIGTFSPADGSTILVTDTASFNVNDETAVTAMFVSVAHSNGVSEVVWDGSAFSSTFSTSTRTPNGNGYDFVIARGAGWLAAGVSFNIVATDGDGNITQNTSYNLVVSNPPPDPDTTTPVIANVQPTPGTAIGRAQALFFDVTDDFSFRRVILVALFDVASGGDGSQEIIHNGDAFAVKYASLSERTIISGGYRYRVRRSGGWPSAPTVVPYAIDTSGNEAP